MCSLGLRHLIASWHRHLRLLVLDLPNVQAERVRLSRPKCPEPPRTSAREVVDGLPLCEAGPGDDRTLGPGSEASAPTRCGRHARQQNGPSSVQETFNRSCQLWAGRRQISELCFPHESSIEGLRRGGFDHEDPLRDPPRCVGGSSQGFLRDSPRPHSEASPCERPHRAARLESGINRYCMTDGIASANP